MNLEDLLGYDASQLEAITDEELVKLCEPFFNVTRPELAIKPNRQPTNTVVPITPSMQAKMKVLAGLGIDVSHLATKKRK